MSKFQPELHGCGGHLFTATVMLAQRKGQLTYIFPVEGLLCDKCHENVIDRNTAVRLESVLSSSVQTLEGPVYTQSMPNVILDVPGDTGTGLKFFSPEGTTNEVVVPA